jgi:hypothetical protein
MTPQVREALFARVLDNEQFAIAFANGRERWLDESEYEDINEYAVLFSEIPGIKVEKMHKRPFAATVLVEGARFKVTLTRRGTLRAEPLP